MGLLIFVWGIYTELQNCMYQTAHGPCLSQSLCDVGHIDDSICKISSTKFFPFQVSDGCLVYGVEHHF